MIVQDTGRAAPINPASDGATLLDRLLQRSSRLYTLPRVAVELLQLTGDPRIGVAELKACIERDPALTMKVLRVVNSSLYGLSSEVGNLGQAVALLGIKPLKLLVLGFSLPDDLFSALAGEQLQRYWETALVRAVAAKAIAETFYQRDGDDAFIGGLVDDIGMLVMLGQLGEPYAKFLQLVWDEEGDVRALERQSLGFDHSQLTAALLAQWNMPQALVAAVTAAADPEKLRRGADEDALPRILYLASLTAGLVGRHRLNVLPELLENGTAFCGLDKPALTSLVEELEPKVADLARALQVPLPEEASYLRVLADAQSQLAELGEELAGPLARLDRAEQLLSALKEQEDAGDTLPLAEGDPPAQRPGAEDGLAEESESYQLASADQMGQSRALLAALQRAVAECRACRDELAVVLIGAAQPSAREAKSLAGACAEAGELLRRACREMGFAHAEEWPISETASAVVLPHCSRREAIDLVRRVHARLAGDVATRGKGAASLISAGVASVDTPPRNFDPSRLLDAAGRCLFAAEASGGQIKSIELY